MDLLVVGAGLFGMVIAELASMDGINTTIIDKRSHIGGNAYSEVDDATGIEVHKYGTHIFHTSNKRVWEYANKYTEFNKYTHKVYTQHQGEVFSLPINLGTINQYFKTNLSPEDAFRLIESQRNEVSIGHPDNLEEKAISLIGKPLYEAFIKGYTQKQWETDPRQLPASIISRLPVRYNYNNDYFDDKYQGIPLHGYTKWFDRLIDQKRINVIFNNDFFNIEDKYNKNTIKGNLPIVYTGPIDRYFEYHHGVLGWRTLDFTWETWNSRDFQGNSVINYADPEIPFTRIHEYKHLHNEREVTYNSNVTIISKEFSRIATVSDDPYYPIRSSSDMDMLAKYRKLAEVEPMVFFGGRLGSYQYLDMHMAIASAISMYENEIKKFFSRKLN